MIDKKNNNVFSRIFTVIGIVFIVAALVLVAWNIYRDNQSGKYAHQALAKLNNEIPKSTDNNLNTSVPDFPAVSQNESLLELDGNKYIGVLSIPKIDLELPVMSSWSYNNLNVAPCRYSGNISESDLIIAGHNYTSFFERIDELNSGDEIIFTECSGEVHSYEVVSSELIGGGNASAMEANSDDWDLTLFTCTWSGWSRVTVRALEIKTNIS